MLNRRFSRPACFAVLAALALVTLAYFPLNKIRAANSGATILPSAAKPLVNLKAPQTAQVTYTGAADAVAALQGGTAAATALASADFNADGAPDVAAGYSTKNGGVLVLYKGNPDAFAPKDTSLYQKAMKGNVPPTFLAQAAAFSLNESPDLIGTGDFNLDGHQDVLVAARGGNLYFLAGDGNGGLLAPQMVNVAGVVRALAVNLDGHVAVSVDGSNGSELGILAPGVAGLKASATYPLPARGESVAWGTLGGGVDVAVGAGSNVAIVYGALTSNWQAETVTLPYRVKGLALGDYISDKDYRTEIALLADDGSIHILQHGTLNTAPPTVAERAARRAASAAAAKAKKVTPPAFNPTALGAWTEAKKLPYSGSAPAGPLSAAAFNTPHLAASTTHDLMVVDAGKSELNILDTSGKTASPSAGVSFSGTPVAAMALPQKIDASRDIVVLTSSQAAPMIATAGSDPAVTVNSTADVDSQGACTNPSVTVGSLSGTITLRTATCAVNNSGAGTYTINVPSGTYDLTSLDTGELSLGDSSTGMNISIVGAGSSTTIIQQTDGKHRVMEQDPNGIGSIVVSLSNLTLTGGDCTNDDGTQFGPNDCSLGGGAFLGDGSGDNTTITSVTMSSNAANPSGSQSGGGQDFGGGVSVYGPNLSIMNSTFSSNTASGDGGGVFYNCCGNGAGSFSISNSSFTGNTLTTSGSGGGGFEMQVTTAGFGNSSISGSTFTGNTATGDGGGMAFAQIDDNVTAGTITVSNSRISGNHAQSGTGLYNEFLPGTFNSNWWGCNAGPGASPCDTFLNDPSATISNWLVLSISANPTQVLANGTSSLTADLTHNNSSTGGFSVPNGTPVTFGGTMDSSVNPTSTTLTGGTQTSTYTAGSSTGNGTGTATVDSQTVSAAITIGAPPAFTSNSGTTFTVGTNSSFPVTASGFPSPSVTQTGGSTPSGVSFSGGSGSGTLSGTPAPGTGGVYSLIFGASNGFSPNASQNFTLTVDQAPVINSSSSTTFAFGTAGSFNLTTAAGTYPAATFSESGPLPNGVNLNPTTGLLSGTPTQAGSFPITITAQNGVSPNATQSFTLNVSQGSTSISVTNVNPSSEAYGMDSTVTITAVLSWSGSGPAPSASNVAINGNGQTGSYSATICGAPSGDTMTCSATYTPSGADTVGTYTESALFAGDSNYSGSNSTATNNFSITQAGTTTSVGSSQNPSVLGQQVTFTATISGEYNLGVRKGAAVTEAVRSGAASKRGLTLKGQAHPPAIGGITGMVTWSDNTGCGMTTVTGGTTQCVTSTLPQGTDTITANYSGDTNHTGSTGALSGGQQVNAAVTSTSIAVTNVSPSSEAYGQDAQITITAVLMWTGNGPTPTASDVSIGGNGPSGSYSGTSCGSPVSDTMTCQATYTPTGADTVGTYTETASFSGDSNYTGSSSSQINNFSITQATSGTMVSSGLNPSAFGQAVTFTATINGEYGMIVRQGPPVVGALSGSVNKKSGLAQRTSPLRAVPTFGFGGTVTWSANTGCGTTSVSGNPGTTQCTTSILPEGDNTISASYSGDNNHSGSSGSLTGGQQVNGPQVMLTPASMNFGNVYLGTMVSQTIMVQNTGTATLMINGVSLTGKGNNTEYRMKNHCPASLNAGDSCAVDVFFTANQIGSRSNTLSVSDNAPGSPQQAGFTATVINPLASFNPTSVNFGTVKQGHSKTASVTISNTGTTQLTITGVAITGTDMGDFGDVSACSAVAPGRSCTVKATFTPTTTGTRSADLTVMDNTQAGTKNIPLTGKGD